MPGFLHLQQIAAVPPAAIAVVDRLGAWYQLPMTKLLEKGIEAVKALPADRQDMAGELLLALATHEPKYELTAEQIEDVRLAIGEADRGEFATTEELAGTWKKFGL